MKPTYRNRYIILDIILIYMYMYVYIYIYTYICKQKKEQLCYTSQIYIRNIVQT